MCNYIGAYCNTISISILLAHELEIWTKSFFTTINECHGFAEVGRFHEVLSFPVPEAWPGGRVWADSSFRRVNQLIKQGETLV